jgi:hypothetical protein
MATLRKGPPSCEPSALQQPRCQADNYFSLLSTGETAIRIRPGVRGPSKYTQLGRRDPAAVQWENRQAHSNSGRITEAEWDYEENIFPAPGEILDRGVPPIMPAELS